MPILSTRGNVFASKSFVSCRPLIAISVAKYAFSSDGVIDEKPQRNVVVVYPLIIEQTLSCTVSCFRFNRSSTARMLELCASALGADIFVLRDLPVWKRVAKKLLQNERIGPSVRDQLQVPSTCNAKKMVVAAST